GGAENIEIDADVSQRLKQIGKERGATLFMTLLSAFNVLLWRYSGQEDLLVGTPIANRNRTETEGLIGFFVNTLVLRTRLNGANGFRDLLEQVRETTLRAYEHQDVPFEKLVEELHPERSLSHHPLFQVLFTLQDGGELKLTGLDLTWMDTENEITKFDLSFFISETENGLYAWFEYDKDLFESATIKRMLAHYKVLAEAIAANPDARLSELPILTEAEREQLRQSNQTATEYGRDECLHRIVELQVAQQPDVVAVIDGQRKITYAELNERANQLAHYLRRKGVGLEVRVGVLLERSLEFDVALLAILKAGGTYVPLDAAYPKQRLQFMLEDAGVNLLLTDEDHAAAATDAAEIIYLDDAETFAGQSPENPENISKADDLAYVMYTSGSTGQPKGVAVTHRAINRLVRNTNYVQLDATDRMGQVSNVSFDAATFEIWGALTSGATLVGLAKETVLSPVEFKGAIAEQQISVMFLTVALFNQVAQAEPDAFAPMRYLLVGGDALDPQSVRRVLRHARPQHLVNACGPTEATTFTVCHEIHEVSSDARTIPVGRPVSNTQVWVLDQNGQV